MIISWNYPEQPLTISFESRYEDENRLNWAIIIPCLWPHLDSYIWTQWQDMLCREYFDLKENSTFCKKNIKYTNVNVFIYFAFEPASIAPRNSRSWVKISGSCRLSLQLRSLPYYETSVMRLDEVLIDYKCCDVSDLVLFWDLLPLGQWQTGPCNFFINNSLWIIDAAVGQIDHLSVGAVTMTIHVAPQM